MTIQQTASLDELTRLLEKAQYKRSFGPTDRELLPDGHTYIFAAGDIFLEISSEDIMGGRCSVNTYRLTGDEIKIYLANFDAARWQNPDLYHQLIEVYNKAQSKYTSWVNNCSKLEGVR